MKHVLLILCGALGLLFFGTGTAHAQLELDAANRLIHGNPGYIPTDYGTSFEGKGHFFQNGGAHYLKIDLNEAYPRIGGSQGMVYFYGDGGYQNVTVRKLYQTSDRSLKSNILPLQSSLSRVMRLRPVSYSLVTTRRSVNTADDTDLGFIAQELEQVLPEAVTTDADGNRLVNYTAVIPLLTGAIQELNARVAALEAQLGK